MTKKTLLALTITAILSQSALAQSISGTILDKQGHPIPLAKITINSGNIAVYTDQNGRFTINKLQQGNIELHVTANKYSHDNFQLTIANQDLTDVNLTLQSTVFEIVDVHATPLHSSSIESALPVSVLSGDDLRLKQASTLGETLKNEVGVHSSYYGPVSASPIIRGLDGPRVMITQNGLDSGDVSRVGPDHAISSDSSTAQQIEVLRGPATLFYGSGAIGGVVNVVDNRIPHDNSESADWQLEHNTVADENSASVNFNTAAAQLALHFDGFWRQSNDYRLAGPAESQYFHQLNEPDEPLEHTKTLANSSAKSAGYTLGTSYLLDSGFVGISYGRVDRTYDVPGHSEHHDEDLPADDSEPLAAEEHVFADLDQNRYQLISEINVQHDLISAIHSKLAYTDYQHQEIENGAVGTTFNSTNFEARFDIFHNEFKGFKGAVSLHYKTNDFEAIGDEAFTPPSTSDTFAIAWLEETHIDQVLLQFGARLEQVDIDPGRFHLANSEQGGSIDLASQSYHPLSASAGLVWDFQPGYNVGVALSFSKRAPSAPESFSQGPHIGTGSFEVGSQFAIHSDADGDFQLSINDQKSTMETAYNLDLTLRKFQGQLGFVVNAFYNRINDFYYQVDTGLFIGDGHDEHDDGHDAPDGIDAAPSGGLPILSYQPQDAQLFGYEVQFIYQFDNPFKLTVFSDYIRGKLIDGGDLPRMPPMRLGSQLNYSADQYEAELSINHYFAQNKFTERETHTSGYTMVDVNVNYFFNIDGTDNILGDMAIYAKIQNLTDTHARVHSSFLKEVVPLPGRGLSLGIRGKF